jgi:hypothetical protein
MAPPLTGFVGLKGEDLFLKKSECIMLNKMKYFWLLLLIAVSSLYIGHIHARVVVIDAFDDASAG